MKPHRPDKRERSSTPSAQGAGADDSINHPPNIPVSSALEVSARHAYLWEDAQASEPRQQYLIPEEYPYCRFPTGSGQRPGPMNPGDRAIISAYGVSTAAGRRDQADGGVADHGGLAGPDERPVAPSPCRITSQAWPQGRSC